MSRKNFNSEESYKRYKAIERDRYYNRTPTYVPREWSNEDILFLIRNNNMTAIQLSGFLRRSIKSIEHERRRLRKSGKLPTIC